MRAGGHVRYSPCVAVEWPVFRAGMAKIVALQPVPDWQATVTAYHTTSYASLQIHHGRVGGSVPLIRVRQVAPSESPGDQSVPVEVRHDRLLGTRIAGAELDMPKRIVTGAQGAYVLAFAHHQQAASAPSERIVHVIRAFLQKGQEQWHPAVPDRPAA